MAVASSRAGSKTPVWIGGSLVAVALGACLAVAGSQGGNQVGGVGVFAVCVVAAFAINWLVFVPSFIAHTERFFDLTGSATYLTVIAIGLVLADDLDARSVLVALMVVIWAVRLGSFLFRRIARDGGDGRFDVMKYDGLQFLMTWTIQGLWVSLTAAAALAIITAPEPVGLGVVGIVGIIVWGGGFAVEVVADAQKSAFKADPANEGAFITTGLWSWSRHPNYFGEIVLWTGIAILAVPVLDGWRWVTLISPVFVFVLLTRISGIPLLERRATKRWGADPGYQRYVERTSVLVPLPPRGP